jgi:hypothetical protein
MVVTENQDAQVRLGRDIRGHTLSPMLSRLIRPVVMARSSDRNHRPLAAAGLT